VTFPDSLGGPRAVGKGQSVRGGRVDSRRSGLLEITSGPPGDPPELCERAAARDVREQHSCARPALAPVTTNSVAAEALARDWCKTARFYAQFGITEGQFLRGGVAGTLDSRA
jgi:hypothetical protein